MQNKKFVNGFQSWMETYTEVAMNVCEKLKDSNSSVWRTIYNTGRGGVYTLCEDLTDEFEELNEEREWDGEFFDEIDKFLTKKLE